MTMAKAREVYDFQMALADTFRKDIFELCERKGIPEEWVLDFVEEDLTYHRFFARHNTDGSVADERDEPRAERLKRIVRESMMRR